MADIDFTNVANKTELIMWAAEMRVRLRTRIANEEAHMLSRRELSHPERVAYQCMDEELVAFFTTLLKDIDKQQTERMQTIAPLTQEGIQPI